MTALADSNRGGLTRSRPLDIIRAYVGLTKPRIIELLLVTTVPTMFLAAAGVGSVWRIVAVFVGGTAAAGAANSLNCYLDRDIDQVMKRTSLRPLARHTVAPRSALTFGLVLGVASVVLLALAVNLLSAALALFAIVYYALIYTLLLKRRTPQAVVAGGVAGSMPVLIGWAGVTGTLGWQAWVLFALMFAWQPPHFWALAMHYRDDYAGAGVPMLPVVAPQRRVTGQILAWTWVTVVLSLLLIPGTAYIYPIAAVLAGGWFVFEAHRLHRRLGRGKTTSSMRLFHVSIAYVTVLFLGVAADALIFHP